MDTGARSAEELAKGAAFFLHAGSDSSPAGYAVELSPSVRGQVRLPGDEASASKARGGDGLAIALAGGFIRITPRELFPARPPDGQFTMLLRLRDPRGTWNAPLAAEYGADGALRYSLSALTRAGKMSLVLEIYTDHGETPFAMEAALDVMGLERWHDVVARFSGAHAALFVDGLLVDEDWPIGVPRGLGRGPVQVGARGAESSTLGGFLGLVDHVALWDSALSNEEVVELSGGWGAAISRGWRLPSGSETGTMQYARAPGGGFIGDCFPFFRDGTYHFYYLFDRRHHRSKAGLGAHQWAHASSGNLVEWTHHPLAIPITEQREGSICTGSVFFHEGTWYGFYATRLPNRSEHLSLAVSADGIRFEKTEPNPFASPRPPYKQGPFRDPHVFRDEATGAFHMLVTAELENPPVAGRGGCLAHLVSTDLRRWEQREPFLVTGYGDQPECSELFSWGGWYYLVFSHFGFAHYRMSRGLFGPWTAPVVDVIDGPLARVMKSAPFAGDRRIGTFFVAEGGYAGSAVFRELVQNQDSTLGSRWVPEMVPTAGAALSPAFSALTGGVTGNARGISIESAQGFAAASLAPVPRDVLVRFRVTPGPATRSLGVALRGSRRFKDALCFQVEPGRGKAGWRRADMESWREGDSAALYGVDGLERSFDVELLAFGDMMDASLDGRRTLIHREETGNGDSMFFFCQDGRARFNDIVVRPIMKGR